MLDTFLRRIERDAIFWSKMLLFSMATYWLMYIPKPWGMEAALWFYVTYVAAVLVRIESEGVEQVLGPRMKTKDNTELSHTTDQDNGPRQDYRMATGTLQRTVHEDDGVPAP